MKNDSILALCDARGGKNFKSSFKVLTPPSVTKRTVLTPLRVYLPKVLTHLRVYLPKVLTPLRVYLPKVLTPHPWLAGASVLDLASLQLYM